MILRTSTFASSLDKLMVTVLSSIWLERHTHGHTFDVVIMCDVSCIIQRMPFIVDPCLYDTKGNCSGIILEFMTLERSLSRGSDISLPEFMKDYSGLKVLTEKHVPLQRKFITLRPNAQNTSSGKKNDYGEEHSWISITSFKENLFFQ